MTRILAGILVACAILASATPVDIRDLTCATDLLVADTVLDEVTPASEIEIQFNVVKFQINNEDLAAEVYFNILTDTVTAQGHDEDGGTSGPELDWTDIKNSVTVKPGHLVECAGIPGCDGFVVDMFAFRRLFPLNATKVVFSAIGQYSANATSSVLQSTTPVSVAAVTSTTGRRLLSTAPDNATVIGNTDIVSMDLTFTTAVVNAAFFPPHDDKNWVIGVAVGVPLGIILLAVAWMACCRRTHASGGRGSGSELYSRGGNDETRILFS